MDSCFCTGAELKWKSKGYVLTDEQKSALKAQALENQKNRELELDEKYESTALKLKLRLSKMKEATEPTPYMKSKGIQVHPGVYTSPAHKITCIPAMDINGKVWSIQYIGDDGTKNFAKDSRKEGCFHVLGGIDKLADSPVIVIAEGYATAATIKEATDLPAVVSAFDAGNLKSVAKAIHEKYPLTPIMMAADDDRHLEQSKGINPGKEKAGEAADAVNGFIVLPIYAPGEQSLNPKQFSDFNDLANRSKLGIEGVKRQIKPKVDRISNRYNRLRLSRKDNVIHIT